MASTNETHVTVKYSRLFSYPALTVIVSITFLVVSLAYFLNLFPLVEYRQWIGAPDLHAQLYRLTPGQLFSTISTSRSFAMFIAAVAGVLFGANIDAHNIFQILMLLAGGIFLAASLRALTPNVLSALQVAPAVFLFFSEACLYALTWQATILDKLALFFTAMATYFVATTDLSRAGTKTVLQRNALLLLIVVCAYNSKESAFALAPSLVLLLASRYMAAKSSLSLRNVWSAFGSALRNLAAPLAYALVHVYIVMHGRLSYNAAEQAHVLGGVVDRNAYHYVLYLFNSDALAHVLNLYPYVPQSTLTTLLIVAGAASVAISAVILTLGSRRSRLLFAWAGPSFLMSFVIPLRTLGDSAYYMLVPSFYLSIVLFVLALTLWERYGQWHRAAYGGALGLGIAAYIVGLVYCAPPYLHVGKMSQNFSGALAQIGSTLPKVGTAAQLDIYWPESEPRTYMFLDPAADREIARFIPGNVSKLGTLIPDSRITVIPYTDASAIRPTENTISIVLGPDLRLLRLTAPTVALDRQSTEHT